jgi:protein translocase SecG subunit
MAILYNLVIALIIITCILLVLIIMVQNPKGGGLSSAFGGGNQIMGARKTSDFLEQTTWILAIVLVILALSSVGVANLSDQDIQNPQEQSTTDDMEEFNDSPDSNIID